MSNLLVTWVYGPESEKIFTETKDSMEVYAKKIGVDFIVFREPPDLKHPLLTKCKIQQFFDTYDRICFVDCDTLFGPESIDVFQTVPEDVIGIREECFDNDPMDKYKLTKGLKNLISEYNAVEAETTPHYNSGLMVIPRKWKFVLDYPEHIKNFPQHHTAEQDYIRHRIHTRAGETVFKLTKEHVALWSTDNRDGFREFRGIKHFAGTPNRANVIKAHKHINTEQLHTGHKLGIVVGHFGMPGAIRFQHALNQQMLGSVPMLVNDDHSWYAFNKTESPELGQNRYQELLSFCSSNRIDFRISNENHRLLHSGGDLSAFHNGLAWAHKHGIEYLVKLSMRAFITKRSWLQETANFMIGMEKKTAMHICWYGKNKTHFPSRSEVVVMHVPTWINGLGMIPRDRWPDAAENLIGKIVTQNIGGEALGPNFFGPDRYHTYPHLFWHDNWLNKEAEGEKFGRDLANQFGVDLGPEFHSNLSAYTPGYIGWC